MTEMTSRERVITALEHREPDRVPFDCTFGYEGYLRLKEYLGLKTEKEVYPSSSWLNIGTPIELLKELHIDLMYIGVPIEDMAKMIWAYRLEPLLSILNLICFF